MGPFFLGLMLEELLISQFPNEVGGFGYKYLVQSICTHQFIMIAFEFGQAATQNVAYVFQFGSSVDFFKPERLGEVPYDFLPWDIALEDYVFQVFCGSTFVARALVLIVGDV